MINECNILGRHCRYLYRVMGTKLVRIDAAGALVEIGDVGAGGPVTFDYSFDRLAVASGGDLYYWDGVTLTQVTDGDIGTVVDMIWVDGYFMTTDGTDLIVTELNDPLSVNPLKYGSSEIDPDPIVGLLKLRDEPAAINRYTIEFFQNIGGDFFPFQRINGAQIQKGAIGTHAACLLDDTIAFLGGGRNEALSIYLAANGTAVPIGTREIDQILSEFTEAQLGLAVLESRIDSGHRHLLVHLLDRTLVYDLAASQKLEEPVWFVLTSTLNGFSQYRARHLAFCYGQWNVGDPTSSKYGYLTDAISTHYGDDVRWEFGTVILYNEGNGAIIHQLELVAVFEWLPVAVGIELEGGGGGEAH